MIEIGYEIARSLVVTSSIVVSIICLYLLILSLAAFRFRAPRPDSIRLQRIVAVIPAHNEEKLLARTINTLRRTSYPRKELSIVVIADNCSDATAEVARSMGVTVIERHNTVHRGKGYALNDFFIRYKGIYGSADIVTIIDADSCVDGDYFKALAETFSCEEVHIMQAYYGVLNPNQTWLTRLMEAALSVFHHLRPAGRIVLGGSSGLRGNGMAFRTSIVKKYGWPCSSIVEEIEMSLFLSQEGYRIYYNPNAQLHAEMPLSQRQAASQRQRWEQGRLALLLSIFPILLRRFCRRPSLHDFDALLELVTPPLTLLLSSLLALGLLHSVGFGADGVGILLLVDLAALCFYVFAGLILRRSSWFIWVSLLMSPIFIAFKLSVYLRMLLHKQTERVRTSRGES